MLHNNLIFFYAVMDSTITKKLVNPVVSIFFSGWYRVTCDTVVQVLRLRKYVQEIIPDLGRMFLLLIWWVFTLYKIRSRLLTAKHGEVVSLLLKLVESSLHKSSGPRFKIWLFAIFVLLYSVLSCSKINVYFPRNTVSKPIFQYCFSDM